MRGRPRQRWLATTGPPMMCLTASASAAGHGMDSRCKNSTANWEIRPCGYQCLCSGFRIRHVPESSINSGVMKSTKESIERFPDEHDTSNQRRQWNWMNRREGMRRRVKPDRESNEGGASEEPRRCYGPERSLGQVTAQVPRNQLRSKRCPCTNRNNSRANHQRSVPRQPHSVRQHGMFPVFYANSVIEERMASIEQ
jgi:hypothetical protein